MHFNSDELAQAAQGPPDSFTKEGILYTQFNVKKGRKKSKAEGFVEKWFSLKGNLLFCMKGISRISGVHGVIVLERCTIELDAEECGDLYSFVIGQGGSDDLIHMACRTESERDDWVSSLHTASYECMKMQQENLREQITRRTGRDPLAVPQALPASTFHLKAEVEDPFIEMCLSCSQLNSTNGVAPNTVIEVLTLVPPNVNWHMVAQTEIVEKSQNPLFLKTVGLGDSTTPLQTRVKLLIYDVKEMQTGIRTQIGQVTFTLEELLSTKKLSRDIITTSQNQAGSVSIMSWNTEQPEETSSSPSHKDTDCFTKTHRRRPSFWDETKTFRTKKKEQVKSLFSNPVCKVFRFPTLSNHHLSVCEVMAESKITFVFPVVFMSHLLRENNVWLDELQRLQTLGSLAHPRPLELVKENAELFSKVLTTSIQNLKTNHQRQTFKASKLKTEPVLATVPTNLHLHRMVVNNEYTLRGASYDIITVGAFTAVPFGFKQGGLHRHLQVFNHQPSFPSRHKLNEQIECGKEFDQLYSDSSSVFDDLHRSCVTESREQLAELHEQLKVQSEKLLGFCEENPIITESVISYSSSQESDSSTTPNSYSLQSHDQWLSAVSTLRISLNELVEKTKACLDRLESVEWLEHISMSKMKCEAFLEKLSSLTKLSLTYAAVLESLSDPFMSNPSLLNRYTAVCSQTFTAAVTGILARVRFNITDTQFLHQLIKIGCLLQFEGLLSCHKHELGMLEDWIIGLEALSNTEFKFIESTSTTTDDYLINPPSISGSRLKFVIHLPMPTMTFRLLPECLQRGQIFRVVPVLFNIGINEMATIAERIGSVALQENLNRKSCSQLRDYYTAYESLFGGVQSSPNSPYSVSELLQKLDLNVKDTKKKNVEVLQLASEISRKLNAVRFTSCKSAKDRTAMSVTIEECNILQQDFELSPHVFNHALSCLRSQGVRRHNSFKNQGVMSYAFTSIQLLSFPKAYKPPTGTYGKGES